MRLFFTVASFLLILFASLSCSSNDPDLFQLNITAVPGEAGSVTPATGEFEKDRTLEISATPNQHWVFDRWEGDHEGTENPVIITIDSDKEIAATFIRRNYPLIIETEGEGSVSERVVQEKTNEYPHGTVVELTAAANEGWEFTGWQGALDGDENPVTITIEGETTVTAVFELITYPLTINTEGQGSVTQEILQSKTTDYPAGTLVQLTAEAADEWVFHQWSGDIEGDENPSEITVDGPKEVTATFLRTFRLSTTAEPEEGGEITPAAGNYVRDSTFDVEAIPNEGWTFTGWEGDFTGSTNPFSLTMNGNKTLVANFEPQEFELTLDISGQGSIETDLISGGETADGFLFNSEVELTAVANTGWRFIRWEGDLEGDENPRVITIDGSKSVTAVFAIFPRGSGTEADPWQVETLFQLDEVRHFREDYFILTENIDASDSQTWNGGLGLEPIGDIGQPFTGSFNGDDFEISNLTINRDGDVYVGLFGYVDSGEIMNLRVTDADIEGTGRVGIIAGSLNGRIENVEVSGSVTGDSYVGGVVGQNLGVVMQAHSSADASGDDYTGGVAGSNENEIIDSSASGNVTGLSFRTGGLAGINSGLIEHSSATGTVEGGNITGGLVGLNRNGAQIIESFATGNVTGNERVGGLAGGNDNGNPAITKSYALGDVEGTDAVGGFVGTNGASGLITESYASGFVDGTGDVGGFAGRNSGTIENSYWDTETSAQSEGAGLGDDDDITSLETDDMTGGEAEDNMTAFDWIETWRTTADYPELMWQEN